MLDIVYSFRLKPDSDGALFHPDYNWKKYEEKTKELLESGDYSYVVMTDITDFYPSIYLHNNETQGDTGRFSKIESAYCRV